MKLASVVDHFLSPVLRGDLERARHARLIVAVCLIGAVVLPLFALRHFFISHNVVAGLVTTTLGAVAVIVLFALRWGTPLPYLVHLLATCVCSAGFAISVSRGGFIVAPIMAPVLIPLILVMLEMRRAAIVWAVLVIAHYTALAGLTRKGWLGTHPETAFDYPQTISFTALSLGIALVYDTTRRSLLREKAQLQEHIAQAQRSEAIGMLAAGVAHDFNNILSVVRMSAESMLYQLPEGHDLRVDARAVVEAVERGAAITAQLVQFARAPVVEGPAFDLSQLVRQLEPILGRLATKSVTLHCECSSEPLTVRGDPRQIERVLFNLIINARDAMQAGGEMWVCVEAKTLERHAVLAPGRYVRLTVRDNGPGIRDSILPHVFEPFFTTKARGAGTGLGLSTAHGVVRSLKGDIKATSEPGRGATFEVLLPLFQSQASPVETEAPPTAPSARPQRRGLVLVVDDQPQVIQATARLLAHAGFDVLSADDPAKALAILDEQERAIDLLLTDIVMPTMDGQALAARARESRPRLPVIYMSGHASDETIQRELDQGRARFLAKPFDRKQLVAEVEQALSKAE